MLYNLMLRGECITYLELFFAAYIQVYQKKKNWLVSNIFPRWIIFIWTLVAVRQGSLIRNNIHEQPWGKKKEGFLATESTIDDDVLQGVWDEVDYRIDASRNKRDAYWAFVMLRRNRKISFTTWLDYIFIWYLITQKLIFEIIQLFLNHPTHIHTHTHTRAHIYS